MKVKNSHVFPRLDFHDSVLPGKYVHSANSLPKIFVLTPNMKRSR